MGSCCASSKVTSSPASTTDQVDQNKPLSVSDNTATDIAVDPNADHPCSILSKNAKLRKRGTFKQEICKSMRSNVVTIKDKHKIDDNGMKFWNSVIDEFEAADIKQKDDDKDDDDDDNWGLEDFWNNLTSIDDKLVDFFDNKIIDFIDENFALWLLTISHAIQETSENVTITGDFFYDLMIKSFPFLDTILPKESPWNDVIDEKSDDYFKNWALTVESKPKKMKNLYSKQDIIEFIAEASANNARVRVMNYSHSFSPLYGDDDCYFGKMLDDIYTDLQPKLIPQKYNDDLTETWVENRPLMFVKLDLDNHRITVGGSTPNSMYVNLVERRIQKGLYNFPAEIANVVQVYQSWVGTHAVGCHGSGIQSTNITQYITRLNIINYEGKEVVYEGDILKTMACHFGLFGIVTEMELQLQPAYYLMYNPYEIKFEDYFPEKGECKLLQKDVNEASYTEYFWYPGRKDVYISAFKPTNDPTDFELFPFSNTKRAWQQVTASLIQFFLSILPLTKDTASSLKGKIIHKLFAVTITANLPQPRDPIKVPSCNGLHFSMGIQNMRVTNMEWSFPLHRLKDDNGDDVLVNGKTVPDVKIGRDLFWECRKLVNKYMDEHKIYPMYLPLEMRFIRGDCDRNNCFGKDIEFCCCIEVLSLRGDNSKNKLFEDFSQILLDRWIDIIGENNKNDINYSRPHWGKHWQNLTVQNKSIYDHLKLSYKQDFIEFNKERKKADPNNMFMNKTFDILLDEQKIN